MKHQKQLDTEAIRMSQQALTKVETLETQHEKAEKRSEKAIAILTISIGNVNKRITNNHTSILMWGLSATLTILIALPLILIALLKGIS